MFIARNDNLIVLAKDTLEELEQALEFMVYTTIEETEEEYELYEGKYLTQAELVAKRQANFEDNFLSTSLGNYRLQPKGYANAQQSIDTVNAMVNVVGGLNELLANMVIFYETPDFTKPEECTEEWLVEHQTHPEPMTIKEWSEFYIEFTTKYAQKMYQQQLNEANNDL